MSADELEDRTQRVENIHAESLVRRRTRIITHTSEAARRVGFDVLEQPSQFLLLYDQRNDAAATDGEKRTCKCGHTFTQDAWYHQRGGD